MRSLDELINRDDPGIELVRKWVREAKVDCEILDPSDFADETLLHLQVTTRSPMGAIAHDTGGLLIQGGWLRFLGSGSPVLTRRIDQWNGSRSSGYLLVADDAVGGLFAINGGALGEDLGNVYYSGPDDTGWMALKTGYSDFLASMLGGGIDGFYQDLRWRDWQSDMNSLPADSAFIFYPFLWSHEGSVEHSERGVAPMAEVRDLKMDLMRQLSRHTGQ